MEKPLSVQQIADLPDEDIDLTDMPQMDAAFWARAHVVMPGSRNLTQVTAKFDKDMVDWFRRQGRGYQARMNAVLRSYYEANKG